MVLIVEPSKELAEIIKKALKKEGMKAVVAHTAQTGITAADNCHPKLVILELLMSDHNGFEFIHEFKSYSEWFDVPIIIYSDLSREQLAADDGMLKDMNIVRHFYKPNTRLEELTRLVRETLV